MARRSRPCAATGPRCRARSAFLQIRRHMDAGDGVIDVIELDGETVTALAQLFTSPYLYSGLLGPLRQPRIALLEYLAEEHVSGSVVVQTPTEAGIILLRDGDILGTYTESQRSLDKATSAVASLATDRRIGHRGQGRRRSHRCHRRRRSAQPRVLAHAAPGSLPGMRRTALWAAAGLVVASLSGCFASPPQIIQLIPNRGAVGRRRRCARSPSSSTGPWSRSSVQGRFSVNHPIRSCDLGAAFERRPARPLPDRLADRGHRVLPPPPSGDLRPEHLVHVHAGRRHQRSERGRQLRRPSVDVHDRARPGDPLGPARRRVQGCARGHTDLIELLDGDGG